MTTMRRFLDWMTLSGQQPEILLAQFRELRRQVPLLYALLMVNAGAVSFTHYGLAPDYLTIWLLLPLFIICSVRAVAWLRRSADAVSPEEALYQLRRTLFLSGVLALAYVTWSLALDSYGGPLERGHVALFIAITVVGCIFCLMNLPQAALLVMALVTVPYIVYYSRLDLTVFHAISMNIFLVSLVLIQVLFNGHKAFTNVIQAQRALAQKQQETERLSEENAILAHTDVLTGLPNRRHFFSALQKRIQDASITRTSFAVGVLDLDRFKPVNDTYGHHFGDLLLAEAGDRLKGLVSSSTRLQISRLGGDEFGMIIEASAEDLEALGQSICDIIATPYEIEGIFVRIGCSCGLAVFPDAGRTVHELFDRSDYALYNSKTGRRGQATLYSVEHERQIRSDRAIESALQGADLEKEFEIYLQPILDLQKCRVTGFEALARWNSPLLGQVPPDQFIPQAERSGLMRRLTVCLFAKALTAISQLPPHLSLSFNLSTHDITCKETVLALLTQLGRSRIPAHRVIFEITETAVMRSYEGAEQSMRLLRQTGARLALDDFGTGYSSLGYLHRLPIDRVKIDKSFVSGIDDPSGHGIVSSIIALCRSMSLDCVVEGIETDTQRDRLQSLGCRYIQGYLIARPMPAKDAASWLEHSDYHQPVAAAGVVPLPLN
ncbi:Bacteriophytochrome cph2 [Pannonibacter phragmitetus]|uniref:Bacteriophytochrome cph2 n=2 Tax=Pannonibacter phragmitetus TaxID=121719 RepID=A0A378ZYJ1_9HYPH|nr:Bacteriophytochrome cph2 [Pannonibacter phragmitetus]